MKSRGPMSDKWESQKKKKREGNYQWENKRKFLRAEQSAGWICSGFWFSLQHNHWDAPAWGAKHQTLKFLICTQQGTMLRKHITETVCPRTQPSFLKNSVYSSWHINASGHHNKSVQVEGAREEIETLQITCPKVTPLVSLSPSPQLLLPFLLHPCPLTYLTHDLLLGCRHNRASKYSKQWVDLPKLAWWLLFKKKKKKCILSTKKGFSSSWHDNKLHH